ncbi:hypothetical protein PBY51_012547 [Eleginops maclovinus]|uniref:Uncharacterized protein n=1 Tax=Eleginops maclovinus TaxID=56733 RepID=A0AAN8AUR1_ELEMC|nr:hypothetical protein PBY51_012547 [Eleginops maclovinus]
MCAECDRADSQLPRVLTHNLCVSSEVSMFPSDSHKASSARKPPSANSSCRNISQSATLSSQHFSGDMSKQGEQPRYSAVVSTVNEGQRGKKCSQNIMCQ